MRKFMNNGFISGGITRPDKGETLCMRGGWRKSEIYAPPSTEDR